MDLQYAGKHSREEFGSIPLFLNSSGNPTEKEEKRIRNKKSWDEVIHMHEQSKRYHAERRKKQQKNNSIQRKKESLERRTRKKKENSMKRDKQKREEKQKMEAMFLGGRSRKRSTR